jgi:polyhydroxyalkanoate synthesis regulator phasin
MVSKDDVQKYLDAGIAFTQLTRAKAEEMVRELVAGGVFPSGDARAKVDELIERSRKGSELIVAQVRSEVTHQLSAMGITSVEDLAREVSTIIGRTADAGRAATQKATPDTGTAGETAKPSEAKKSEAKKSEAKKAPAKKATAKSAPAKTSGAKSSTKKATAKSTAHRPTRAPPEASPEASPKAEPGTVD